MSTTYIKDGKVVHGKPSRPLYLVPYDVLSYTLSGVHHFIVSCCNGNTTRQGMGSGVIKMGPKRPWNSKQDPPIARNIKGMDSINPPGACGPAGG